MKEGSEGKKGGRYRTLRRGEGEGDRGMGREGGGRRERVNLFSSPKDSPFS